MESVLTLTSGVVVLCRLGPLVVLLGGLMVFGLVGHVLHSGPMVSRPAFDCPFSKQKASVEFLAGAVSDHPTDVLSCSVFAPKPYHVRCEKSVPWSGRNAVGAVSDDAALRLALRRGSLPRYARKRESGGRGDSGKEAEEGGKLRRARRRGWARRRLGRGGGSKRTGIGVEREPHPFLVPVGPINSGCVRCPVPAFCRRPDSRLRVLAAISL